MESLFKIHAIGIVAKDIVEDEHYIDIYPIELHPTVDGDPSIINDTTAEIIDNDGNDETIVVNKGNIKKEMDII